ncbi:MAG: LysR family transcriptional regulator [Acidobacteria bacterium]|nr:LysR family transcriptional regulator [Acidobacteriota bacterium]
MVQDSALLNVFYTVVNERSFTRAAEKLFRTQPAVSLAIQRLEAEIGETLLDRSGRDLALTDTGKIVYECARQQENLHRSLVNQIQETRNKSVGRLCIGANESMTLYLLPHLCEFRKAYPKVKVVVQRSRSGEIPDRLLAGDADLGVVSYSVTDERFRAHPLYVDHLSFVVPPSHRLAKQASLSIKDLEMEVFVAHNVASPYRDAVIRAFRDAKVPLNMDIEMPTVESIRRMVQAGQGVAFLPRMCVDQDVRQGALKEVKVKELRVERRINLVSVEKRSLSHAARAFLDLVKADQRKASA